MLGVHPEHPYDNKHATTLQARAEDASDAFEACFAALRTFRVSLMATSKAVTETQEPLESFKSAASAALDGSAWSELSKAVQDLAAREASEEQRAAATCVEAMEALRTAISDAPDRREISQALLTRPTSRPISRLASTMQARDSVEQRISHVMSGYELATMTAEPTAVDMTRILAAQVASIAEALRESATTISESSTALHEAFPEVFAEGLAISNVTEAFSAFKTSLEGVEISKQTGGFPAAMTSLCPRTTEVDSECALQAHGSAYTGLVALLEQMQEQADAIEAIANDFEAVGEAMLKDLPDQEQASAGGEEIDTLKSMYTSEIEHAIHKSAAQRS